MFNWYGQQKIGIVGAANSGKTMLLTSLLWHLENHDPDRFGLKGERRICNFHMIGGRDHDFNFQKHKNTMIQKRRWPEKTMDYAIAECKYQMSGRVCERHVTFVDIPGERISDILIWQAKNYQEWVRKLFIFWQSNPENERIMKPYRDFADRTDSTVGQLTEGYKRSMWFMLDNYCQITPSTYYLGTDGSMLGDENNSDREKAILERRIWDEGDLLPLPEDWGKAHPAEYRKMEKIFHNYRKKVLKPLFREIDDCDHFIFCVDIPGILNNGSSCLLQTQLTFKDFIETLAPSRFMQLLDFIGRNPPRLAYAATKSDMVSDPDQLKWLLKDFSGPLNYAGIDREFFTCSACVSSEQKSRNGKNVLVGNDSDDPAVILTMPEQLPKEWPNEWDPVDYSFPEIAPKLYAIRPPDQVNLNKIFDFIVEGIRQ